MTVWQSTHRLSMVLVIQPKRARICDSFDAANFSGANILIQGPDKK